MKRIIRKNEVVDRAGESYSSINRKEKAGQFPRRVRLGANSVGWYEDEIETYLDNLPRGHADPHPDATAKRIENAAERRSARVTSNA